jgi:hypothetical protein
VSLSYDAVMSFRHLLPQPSSRRWDLTGWPLSSSVLSTPDTRLVKSPLQPRNDHKREARYPEPRMRKLHVRPSSASPPLLFCLQLVVTP